MLTFLYKYMLWHYTSGLAALGERAADGAGFILHFIAPGQLLATLFSPWSRLHESYRSGIHPKQQAGVFAVNTIMRLVGAVVRIAVLVFGLISFLLFLLLAAAAFVLWLLLPVVAVAVVVLAFNIFFS